MAKCKRWNKKEPIPCWDCMSPACAENGDGHWYCLNCFAQMDWENVEYDETLEVCKEQLKKQLGVLEI